MADNKSMETARRNLAANQEAQEKAREKDARLPEDVKPTPTQEENDLAKLGGHITEHEPDGSPEQGPPFGPQTKQSEARPSQGGYTTRDAKPAASRQANPASQTS